MSIVVSIVRKELAAHDKISDPHAQWRFRERMSSPGRAVSQASACTASEFRDPLNSVPDECLIVLLDRLAAKGDTSKVKANLLGIRMRRAGLVCPMCGGTKVPKRTRIVCDRCGAWWDKKEAA